jgi:hypothetical protein
VVEQEDSSEECGRKVRAPEEDVELEPGEVEGEEADEGEDELGQVGPRYLGHVPGQEAGVKVCAVDHAGPEVSEEQDEVPGEQNIMITWKILDNTERALDNPTALAYFIECNGGFRVRVG